MPLLTYSFLKDLIKEKGRPVSTEELIEHVSKKVRSASANVMKNVKMLERTGLVSRGYSKGSYIWTVKDPVLSNEQILRKYPELYEQSLFGEEHFNGMEEKK